MPKLIVLDTNVFVAALLGSSGANRKVFRDCLAGRYRPLMGAALFTEYESLLARDPPFKHSALNSKERENLFDAFLSVCQWTNIYYGWRPNLADEADNHLVELAVAGGAEMIVTNNIKDFKRSEFHFPGLRIVTPQTLLKEES